MNEMEMFLEALGKAFQYADKIPGIKSIHWDISYHGTYESKEALREGIEQKMAEAGMADVRSK